MGPSDADVVKLLVRKGSYKVRSSMRECVLRGGGLPEGGLPEGGLPEGGGASRGAACSLRDDVWMGKVAGWDPPMQMS